MEINIGINKDSTLAVAQELSKLLSDEYVLYTKTRNAHWNVTGSDFYDKHKLFESQYEKLDEIIDNIAERIRSIGHYAPASLKQFLQLTHLTETNVETNSSVNFTKALLQDHESVIKKIRENIAPFSEKYNDAGTSDFITGLLEQHEKMAWFLRSHLQ